MKKCKNCGADIPDGKVYCPFCGTPVQVVPDYNMLDDEALSSIIQEDSEESRNGQKHEIDPVIAQLAEDSNVRPAEKKRSKKKIFLTAVLAFVLASGLGIGLYLNSYQYDMAHGQRALTDGNLETAETAFLDAVEKKKQQDAKSLYYLGLTYQKEKKTGQAEDALKKAFSIDSENSDILTALLKLYYDKNDNSSIKALKDQVSDSKLTALIDSYLIEDVRFSLDGGDYSDDQTLKLSGEGGTIYYTLNGESPNSKNGIRYTKPIELTDGETRVRAAIINSDGKSGPISEKTYRVTYEEPSQPQATPDGGTYNTPVTITLTGDEGCTLYYTWDGSDPTSASTEYTEPIEMPAGNNILSVIAVNRHNMVSRILRLNYIYLSDQNQS
ncbi:MAG: chitobiase/beta-hexosaminidase C-terminal domain-containing protein [Lachnospiraceae bacterium]|nr:chitobiase/beta-hexosaminidase C-terminal domain-containing protein [Lachnospiraceae bacterium]